MVKSSIERSAYITEIHNKTNIQEKAIIEDFESYEKSNLSISKNKEEDASVNQISRKDSLERKLFGVIFWLNQKGSNDLSKEIEEFKEKIGQSLFDKVKESHEPFKETLAFEAEMWYGTETNTLARDIKEITLNLEEEILNEEKAALQPLDSEEKLKKFNIISKRIEEIKQSRSS